MWGILMSKQNKEFTQIRVWVSKKTNKEFSKFCEDFGISKADLLRVGALLFMNRLKTEQPILLNLFTTSVKDLMKGKWLKDVWKNVKDGRCMP